MVFRKPRRSLNKKVHWITSKQLRAVKNSIRHDLMDRLMALGPSSVKALSSAMRCKPTAIYRHIQFLERIGLVTAMKATGERGRPATVYRAVAPLIRAARAAKNPRNHRVMSQIAKAMGTLAYRSYAAAYRGKDWETEGPRRNQWCFRLFTAPSARKLARINALFDELASLISTPDPNPGPLMRVTWIMSPAPWTRRRRTSKKK
jgi:predicted ArsR family transcriptional regulator